MKRKEDADDLSATAAAAASSSYLQVKSQPMCTSAGPPSARLRFLSIYFYSILLLLIFIISFYTFLHTEPSSASSLNHRSKRQTSSAIDKHHNTDMLRQLLLRSTSSVLSDCSVNVASTGIYQLPAEHTVSASIIRLVERNFDGELQALRRTADRLRAKLNQSTNVAVAEPTLDRFRHELGPDVRVLLASQTRLNEIDIRTLPTDNGGSDVLKYARGSQSVDYDAITDEVTKQDVILQTFTMSHVRETLKQDAQRVLSRAGWWLGPVLCERNPNETFLMAKILPLSNGYVTATRWRYSHISYFS